MCLKMISSSLVLWTLHEEGFADQDGANYSAQELIKNEIIANGEFA